MTIQQPVLTTNQITEITNYVNAYRAKNQAPPLIWDATIAEFSQSWSFYLISNNEFKHSGNHLYGENLAYFQGYGTDVMALLKKQLIYGMMKLCCIISTTQDFQAPLDILHVWYGKPAQNLQWVFL